MFEENVDKRTYAMKDSELLRRLLAYAKPYWAQFIVIFVNTPIEKAKTTFQQV